MQQFSPYKIACILPTRGLFFAKTIEGVIRNGYALQGGLFIMIDESGNGYPMPECFNKGVRDALETDCTHILFVEEDNEIPDGIVQEMAGEGKPIVVLEYSMAKGQTSVDRDKDGIPISSGIGCALFERAVFEAIEYPWFEVDKVVNAKTNKITRLPDHQIPKKYGGHDRLFFLKAREKGYNIHVLAGKKGRHFRVKEFQKPERNHGTYTIYSL